MFHNAARLARHLPQRTDTPITDGGPPSSDPPSSGTVPSSSSPPTPQDHSTSQVAVDPIFVEPALVDLQESSSEPVLAHQYLRYAEGLEKDVDDSEIEVAHPSVPPSGFVQRVKAMLESKATAEAAASHEFEREKVSPVPPADEEMAIVQYGNNVDDFGVHELAANEAARFTIIEEYEAPVELPASPVRLAELPASPVQPRRRITREMVKAELAPSSLDNTMLQTDSGDSTSIDFVLGSTPRHSVASGKDQPSTPANVIPKKSVDAASASTASPIAIEVSTVDYATRLDDTASSDETHSKDPFILDADTITLQHQRSKERVNKAGQLFEQDEARSAQDPVSSMLTGEDVSRYSAVSPMHTQTLGIDETIRTAPDNTANDSTFADELDRTVPGPYPEETQPASTPKTPKTYSKSVQLQPTTALTDASTPTSSRLSLPPDLSSYADSSMNDTSELVTDVAVRFSLPQTTITVNKPQIIEIPPSSSPVHEMTLAQLAKPTVYASTSRAKRGLVTFADEIAPLNITKPAHHKPTEPQVVRKSIIRRVSPLHDFADASRASRESTTDLRFTSINPMNNRFGNTHLPRLKEESIEDASISDRHKSDGSIGFQFPLPARIAAVKAMQERRLQESAENARTRRGHRFPNRPLSETRDLPSLNFSRMDLIDKLNEALEVRSSKSMELLRRRDFSAIYAPSPQRPQSTEPLRERYMSFFSKPEDFSSFFLDQDGSEDGADEHDEVKPDQLPNAEVQPSTEVGAATDGNRPLSPEDFLSFANQVKRLSIPSVTGLSDRLSEMLPNLRDLQLDSVLANFSEVTEAMRDGVRPGTILSTRTSAGFRTLAERAEEIVKNGTHDSTLPVSRLLSTHGVLPDGMSADKISAINSIDGRLSALTGSVSAPSELGKDVTRPASALTRARGPANEEEVQALLPPEMNPITRSAKRALLVSSSSSRPWNQDENYPWAGTKIDVDLMVPSQAHTRSSMASEILRKRKTKSLEIGSTGDVSSITKGIDIGSLYEHNATASLNSEQLTGVSSPHHDGHGKSSKRSVMGSLTHKLGLGSKCDGNTTIRSIPTPSDIVRSGSTVPHRPGERYPTSGLTPPAGFNLDEVRSFFSDDSSERERNASFRKRLTKLKGKKSAVRLDGCGGGMARRHSHRRSLDDDTAYDAGLMSVERAGATSSALTIDGVGMGKTEFRIKRFGEKIRSLMAKGGELIRSLSQRSSKVVGHGRGEGGNGGGATRAVRDDWLSDSLYSGV
ncbi:hypothetical protein BDY17DRAFT_299864 [Neohortaea acidophila]|uniref:Uncharacterized protein n=1 Tax=Neohortaea acidophila TaxID=245834 RepID=A0A6A6PP71_9PEZI|nr:uncharacterized protein BDY17DRAFT_299864 [Neohortaea acidophila]KAF2481879.1 hypothetical protein BDY17DRAFT_299864 [Neohortaea acidophila]